MIKKSKILTNLIDHRHLHRKPKEPAHLCNRRARRRVPRHPQHKRRGERRGAGRFWRVQHGRVIRRGAGVVRSPRRVRRCCLQRVLAVLVPYSYAVCGQDKGGWCQEEEEEEGGER